jgi:hypothetical protein
MYKVSIKEQGPKYLESKCVRDLEDSHTMKTDHVIILPKTVCVCVCVCVCVYTLISHLGKCKSAIKWELALLWEELQ